MVGAQLYIITQIST